MDVFLDEAGYTGPDLINADQPVFILASTIVDAGDARALLDFHFEKPLPEVKYSRRSKSRRGRAQILEFLRALKVDRCRFAYFAFHKQFLLLTNLIDFWLEPIMRDSGVNLYERGGNIALANASYLTLGTCLGLDGRRELLRRFQVMTRDRTPFAFRNFWNSLRQAVNAHDLVAQVLGGFPLAEDLLGYDHLLQLPANMLDPGDIGLIDTVQHWRKQQAAGTEFELFHDRSTLLEQQRMFWEAILDPSNPAAVVGQDRRTIEFPLPVRALRLEDSTQFAQLQVADVVAGAARSIWNARVAGSSNEYCEALLDTGLLNGLAGGVVPTALVTPEDLETVGPVLRDTAEFVASLLKLHGGAE
jgi:PAS domain-containing protein